jgi:hypothetical protein
MATIEIIGARAFEADNRTLEVLREHAPEAAERITKALGDPLPSFHIPEHELFLSESVAALAAVVDKLATPESQAKPARKPGRPRKEAS